MEIGQETPELPLSEVGLRDFSCNRKPILELPFLGQTKTLLLAVSLTDLHIIPKLENSKKSQKRPKMTLWPFSREPTHISFVVVEFSLISSLSSPTMFRLSDTPTAIQLFSWFVETTNCTTLASGLTSNDIQ